MGSPGEDRPASRWQSWRALLWPTPLAIDARERWRLTGGVALGLLFAAVVARLLGSDPWLVAPIGASAVIVFALPSSPLAQPWAVIGGNTISALAGIAAVHLVQALHGSTLLATVLGGALATASMITLRCLHPPGGAAAVLVALGGVRDFHFALVPISLDSLLLVLAGMAYNRVTGKTYPHRSVPAHPAHAAGRFADADIDRVLARWNQVLDVPRDELHALLEAAESEAYQRRMGTLTCGDVMSSDVLSVEYGTPLHEAWRLLRQRGVKALPVVDRWRNVVGVVTLADFLDGAGLDQHEGVGERLRKLLRPTTTLHSDKPEVVGQLMTRRVQVVSVNSTLSALVPVFSVTGHHHLPVVDEKLKLVGIITQTDLVRALQRQVP
jgi:CBS domain-containing membrane protein